METEIKNLQTQLAEFTATMAQKINELKNKPTELKVGTWYKNTYEGANNLYCYQGVGKDHYGFTIGTDLWTTGYGNGCIKHSPEMQIPATVQEIQDRLIDEAKKRYPKLPCKVTYLDNVSGKLTGYALHYNEIDNALYATSPNEDAVYCKGKWAEIIPESTFEIGKWYYQPSSNTIACPINKTECYGLRQGREWFNKATWLEGINWQLGNWRLASALEIEKGLLVAASLMGFNPGRTLNFISAMDGYEKIDVFIKDIHYSTLHNSLEVDGYTIFKQGAWSKITKSNDNVLEIGGYEVKFFDNGHTLIDGHEFRKEFWQAAKLIAEHKKAKIMVGCSKQFDVPLITINQILERLK